MRSTLLVEGLIVVGLIILATGCASVDNPYGVTITNDMQIIVEVLQCDDEACVNGEFHDRELLSPGESLGAGVSTRGIPNPWLVRNTKGRRLGCLPLVMPQPTDGVTAYTSQLVACQKTYDQETPWPPDQ